MLKRKSVALVLAVSQAIIILPLLFWLFQQATPAHAADFNVNTFTDVTDGNCTDGTCSLRDAISLSTPFDTIYLPAGSYVLNSGLGQLSVAKTITITGQGATAADTTIDGNNAIRLFSLSAGTVTFSNLTLQNGQPASGNGGGILANGFSSVTLDNAILRNNVTVGNGGGIFLSGGTLNILNGSAVLSNTAVATGNASGGGVYVNQGTINLTDSTIANNSAMRGGGIALNLATATLNINNSQIMSNAGLAPGPTSFPGGGIWVSNGSVIMNSGLISGNTAFRGGGALISSGFFTLTGGTITDNEANYGGGFYVVNPEALLTIDGGSIQANRSIATIFGGGALYIFQGQVVQNGGEMRDNTAVNLGGAMEVRQGGFTMNGGTIAGNSANNWGGAIYNDQGFITITNGTFSSNYSLLGGGAIATGPTSQNSISNSVIYTNSTSITQTGGAILNTGFLTLTNVTLSDNFANSGGGLQNQGTATLTNVTVFENTAVSNGGGLNGSSGTLSIVNSIVAGNSAPTGPDCAGTIVSQDYNLIQDSTGCTISGSTGNNLSGAPLLTALALNGGSTLNHALTSGSPALDAGNNSSCPATDQRGVTRPIDGDNDTTATCDVGAVEFGIQIEIGNATVTEGDSGTVSASFTVTRSMQTSGTDTVTYATATDSADGSDFTAVPATTLTFNPGDITKTISIDVIGDTMDESDETFFVQLSNPSAGVFISQASGTGTILDDDGPPSLTIADSSITEGNAGTATATFTVTLSSASDSTVQVNYTSSDETAVSSSDYDANSNILTFNPGDTQEIINITVNGDTTDEIDETFLITLSNPSNATIADGQATGTILDDDNPPSLTIADSSVTEGDSGTTSATFTVTLSASSSKTVSVNYSTSNANATAGTDYTAVSSSLTFTPGDTEEIITVFVNGDLIDEDSETFLVTLSGESNAIIGDGQATGTINDNDDPPTISIDDPTITEGNSGSSNATFTLTLDQASSKTITVDYATQANTASTGTDFTSASGTVTFTPGDTEKTVLIAVLGDTTDEENETFFLDLSNATNAALPNSQSQATITDDDAAPMISVENITITEGNSGTETAVFTITLSHASSKTITVDVQTSNDSATAGEDYTAVPATTLTFTPGASLSQTVNVTILNDTTSETSETFHLLLSSPSNATLSNTQATATITDNDGSFIYLPFIINP